MAKGDRPVIRISGKRLDKAEENGPEFLDLCAFWVDDRNPDRLSGRWDRSIVAIKVVDRAGNEHRLSLDNYFCNIRDEREGSQRAGRPAPNPVRRQRREEPPNFGDPDPDNYDDEAPPF